MRIAWWSGHSDARYAGSTWYCDEHLDELNKKCVADINLDLTGCKLAEQVRARTTCMEGEDFTASVIEGYKAKPYIPMIRGGDQSFWGAHIPIDIMFKYEPVDEKRVSACPSGGPWWHTEQDTLDKLDNDILYRDALMNLKIACRILNSQVLPVEMCGFVEKMQGFLNDINASTEPDFDLTQVINAIEKIIEELEVNMKVQFKEQFTQVNENFKYVYKRLFGGGEGELTILDEDNILESDIQITAKPPGKKMKNLNLLSGGEKALTAISILFAIILAKPTPFCILDEIEAPLDDANIFRFGEYLKELSEDTQFIAVTHRRGTMEAADYIYGVTMEQKAISKVISLDLHEAHKMTDIV